MPASTFTFKGEELSFSPERDIGLTELRNIKGWFPDLGDYQAFTIAASLGDPDALACLIWIAHRKAGKKIKDPTNFPDFSVGEVMGSFVSDGVPTTIQRVPPIRLTLNGDEEVFDIEKDLTYKTLKQIKRWYPSIGSLVRFTVAIFRGDPDALACMAWVAWGGMTDKSIPLPANIDLAAGTLIDSFDYEEPEEPEEPEAPELLQVLLSDENKQVDPPLPSDGASSSMEIQKNSGDFTPTSDSSLALAPVKPKAARSSNI